MPTSQHTNEPPRVGEAVRIKFGHHTLRGTVVEDRGPIGAGGRRLFRVQMETAPDEIEVVEVPADEIERIGADNSEAALSNAEIIDYLVAGGLVSILRQNMAGGRNQPRVWLRRDSHGNVTHTFIAEHGVLGGSTIPFYSLHGRDRVFEPKADEVKDFLRRFGLTQQESAHVVHQIGLAP
jgi:hypothetical protein